MSFPVTILNDVVAEGPEEFLLQLTTAEQHVTLDPSQLDVEIIDDDGKLNVCEYFLESELLFTYPISVLLMSYLPMWRLQKIMIIFFDNLFT